MSGPPTDPDDDAMLRRLAEMDMAAAEKAHAALMAAETTAEIAEAMRCYQRAARSVRQTLMLKARLKRMAVQITPVGAPGAFASPYAADRAGAALWDPDDPVGARVEALQDAVGRVIAAAHPDDAERQEALFAQQDALMDAEAERPDFLHHPLEAQVADQCESLGLPAELAARWSELPPGQWADPDEEDPGPPLPGTPPAHLHSG
jgi:hypothetical protein